MQWKKSLFAALGLLIASTGFAMDQNNPNSFSIGIGAASKKGVSQETWRGHKLKKKQAEGSVRLAYEYVEADSPYGAIDFDWRGYESHNLTITSGGTTIAKIDASDMFYNMQARLGYTFQSSMDFFITPFVGLGVASSKLDIVSSSSLPTSDAYLLREWKFYSFGVRFEGALDDNWDLGARIQVMGDFGDPKIQYNITDIKSQKVAKKVNYSVEIPVTYNFDQSVSSLRLTPFYESQNFGATKEAPISSTDQFKSWVLGARLEYVYNF